MCACRALIEKTNKILCSKFSLLENVEGFKQVLPVILDLLRTELPERLGWLQNASKTRAQPGSGTRSQSPRSIRCLAKHANLGDSIQEGLWGPNPSEPALLGAGQGITDDTEGASRLRQARYLRA